MKRQTVAPADTRMMGIIHDALRRDLERTRRALTERPCPEDGRRVAIAGHVRWMMRFLHDHHSGEDQGLWPMLRRKAPDAAPLLDSMEEDHAGIAGAMAVVEAAAQRYAGSGSDEVRIDLLEALTTLDDVLLPHLRREEQEAMPVAAAALTTAEWRRWEQEYNVKRKSFTELGDVGHWLLDGLDDTRYQIVVQQVPTIPRFILVHGFARRYRRRSARRWSPPAPRAVQG
ncbi:hemerythrin domain-containing protein [Sphaerisporangium sp. NPDC051011]|uniref:hemerythrin domain-containing protein n=1 Tax=Sphaerisporangium sp. NPDC051011 TaxID=3155792 RepID=UPI0033D7BB57